MPPQSITLPHTCEHCGAAFRAKACHVNRFCSRPCANDAMRGLRGPRCAGATWPGSFWAKVNQGAECWEWRGRPRPDGYCLTTTPTQRYRYVHRVAWEIASGAPIPDGYVICHTCDNRRCVRADDVGWYDLDGVWLPRRGHLFLGTLQDNNTDRRLKGRYSGPRARRRPALLPTP